MPLITPSTYIASNLLKGHPHLQTVVPSIIRRIYPAGYQRERLELPDGDFVDIDWSADFSQRRKQLVVVCHGLEGSSQAPYCKGMSRAFRRAGWDVALMNFRSCSGELNRLSRSYHSGETEDLANVLAHVAGYYDEIALVGFSLGGNVVLKYLGEQAENIPQQVKGAVTFSVPCDLAGSGDTLKKPGNLFYMQRFLRMLDKKVHAKYQRGDDIASPVSIKTMTSFWEFDDAYTAPLHGFNGADDYYQQCSSRQYLQRIAIPALLVNARNDPFLSKECFPVPEAQASKRFFFEAPEEGGHCGFPTAALLGLQWHERRALEFLQHNVLMMK